MEFYYQIKGKLTEPGSGLYGGSSNWSFPPIFSGMVEAESKKDAHVKVNDEYGKQFPLRVLAKDLDNNEFLLNITEINDDRTRGLFIVRNCKHCDTTFRQIDHYNDSNRYYKGNEYCSQECRNEAAEIQRYIYSNDNELGGCHQPVIYKVVNNETGMCYIGKTTQAFTLRWYQHFYQAGGTKFHMAIKSTPIEHWSFSVIEKIIITTDIKSKAAIEALIFERERYWINHYDSVNTGYNSI